MLVEETRKSWGERQNRIELGKQSEDVEAIKQEFAKERQKRFNVGQKQADPSRTVIITTSHHMQQDSILNRSD